MMFVFRKSGFANIVLVMTFSLLASMAYAHHSYSIFELDNEIEVQGKLTRFDFIQPHIKMSLEVVLDNGEKEQWAIETMSPARWRRYDLDAEHVKVGDLVTLSGWPARNGKPHMALTKIKGKKGTMVVLELHEIQ